MRAVGADHDGPEAPALPVAETSLAAGLLARVGTPPHKPPLLPGMLHWDAGAGDAGGQASDEVVVGLGLCPPRRRLGHLRRLLLLSHRRQVVAGQMAEGAGDNLVERRSSPSLHGHLVGVVLRRNINLVRRPGLGATPTSAVIGAVLAPLVLRPSVAAPLRPLAWRGSHRAASTRRARCPGTPALCALRRDRGKDRSPLRRGLLPWLWPILLRHRRHRPRDARRRRPRVLADAAVDGVALGDGGVGDLVVEAERLKKGRGGGAGPKKSCADAVGSVGSSGVSRKVSATTVATAGIPRPGSMCWWSADVAVGSGAMSVVGGISASGGAFPCALGDVGLVGAAEGATVDIAARMSCGLGGRRPVVDCAGVARPDAEALIAKVASKGSAPTASRAAARALEAGVTKKSVGVSPPPAAGAGVGGAEGMGAIGAAGVDGVADARGDVGRRRWGMGFT